MKWMLAVLFGAMAAAAGPEAQAQEWSGQDVTEYRFLDEGVFGEVIGPGGVGITVRRPGSQRSLIRVRAHFVPEMLKSVEHI